MVTRESARTPERDRDGATSMASARPASLRPTETKGRGTDSDSVDDERSPPAEDRTASALPSSDLLTVVSDPTAVSSV
jgi:hypothetical protein